MAHALRFRAMLADLGLPHPDAAQLLHVSLRTLQNWLSGRHEVPYAAYKLLRLLRYMELPGQAWSGWHFSRGQLVTPEGRTISGKDGSWWSLLVRQAHSFGELYRELQFVRMSQPATTQGQRGAEGGRVAHGSASPACRACLSINKSDRESPYKSYKGPRWGHNGTMAYNLRLPPALDVDARARCERLGISLNALLCVALDAYLRDASRAAPSPDSPGQAGPEPAAAGRFVAEPGLSAAPSAPAQAGIQKLSKQQRREHTRLERQGRKF